MIYREADCNNSPLRFIFSSFLFSSVFFLFRLPFVVTLSVNTCDTVRYAVTTTVVGDENRDG